MSKRNIVLLVFALVFVTVSSVFLFFEGLATFGSFDAIFNSDKEGWDAVGEAIGGVFLYIYVIILGFFALLSAAATLPFNLILMKGGRKWFNIAILAFSITAMVLAVAFAAALPIVAKVIESTSSSSSSISSSSI